METTTDVETTIDMETTEMAVATAIPSAPMSKDEWVVLDKDVQQKHQHEEKRWQQYLQCAKNHITNQPPTVIIGALTAATAMTVLSLVVQQPCLLLCFVTLNINTKKKD